MNSAHKWRSAFLDFFAARGHEVKPSAPLIPEGDASLMFNSAGMVPFKPYFLGIKTGLPRAASCQKCFRTTDIGRVGQTVRHMTFFEMLGNFSFGDYFKEETIAWAWEFLTKTAGYDPKLLHPTIFKDDDEALAIWKKMGPVHAPVKLGEDTNFWMMGPTGPCGPCSEIYFDRGAAYSCGKPSCSVGCDCDRYIEIWNLVFTQFDRQADGSLKSLPRKNIDTGMGLERLLFTLEGAASPFETSLFAPVVEAAAQATGVSPKKDAAATTAFHVIAEHARASVFLMSEGVLPSNVERGYVLRRLIRRALRYGQLLGYRDSFLYKLVPAVVSAMKDAYPELETQSSAVTVALRAEEEKFLETLENGERELSRLLAEPRKILGGSEAFRLYETFGFPLELTKEICEAKGVAVDEEGFQKASKEASELARSSWKGSGEKNWLASASFASLSTSGGTEFLGYEALESPATLIAAERQGEFWVLVLDRTSFYPEGGGQVGDEGALWDADGRQVVAEVVDTQKQEGVVFHIARAKTPLALKPGLKVVAKVDAVRRAYVRPHHTATHLLNEALRRLVGPNVRQAGSYVGADKLRFDFTCPKALGREKLSDLERMVSDEIRLGLPVETKVEPIEKAKTYGAVALIGENYGAKPRMVLIGSKGWKDPMDRFSLELCGGTHVHNTAEIERFKILKESAVSAGVRRIEAVAGKAVFDFERLKTQEEAETAVKLLARQRELLDEITALGGKADESPKDARSEHDLRLREKELTELLGRLKAKKLDAEAQTGGLVIQVGPLRLRAQRFEGARPDQLRGLADKLKSELGSGIAFAASPANGKLSFVLSATKDLTARFDAAAAAKAFAASRGGSAGGRADFAQGGVADADWQELLKSLGERISAALKP